MQITAEDIKREHDAALAALTPAQRRALDRLARARRLASFNHRWASENLSAMFQAEAEAQSAELPRAA